MAVLLMSRPYEKGAHAENCSVKNCPCLSLAGFGRPNARYDRGASSQASCERLIVRTGRRNVRAPCWPGIFPPNIWRCHHERSIEHLTRAPRKILRPRRLTLLASAAGLSMAVLLAGPGGYRPFNLPAWTASAHAAETGASPRGLRRSRRQGQTRGHIGPRQDR